MSVKTPKNRNELGYTKNHEIPISRIRSLHIENFRGIKNREVQLGSSLTIIAGCNGSMKSSLLGLIAHPFDSNAKDFFGRSIKTPISEVFKFSTEKDIETYKYFIDLEVIAHDSSAQIMYEPVTVRVLGNRLRIVPSGHEAGDGFFNLNTSYLSLVRLYPITDSRATPISGTTTLTTEEQRQQKEFYHDIFSSQGYSEFEGVADTSKKKNTFGPSGVNSTYDFNAISSGEDNLGSLFNKMIGFQRASITTRNDVLNGIFCIDEIESSLHPSSQIRLIKYLLKWALKHRIQIVATSHSPFLIQNIYDAYSNKINDKEIILNFISTASSGIGKNHPIHINPTLEKAYQELTHIHLKTQKTKNENKVHVLCEDKIAEHFIKLLIKATTIKSKLIFNSDLTLGIGDQGTTNTVLLGLCKNAPFLLSNAVIVVDADTDVSPSKIGRLPDKSILVRLPDANGYALERRIAKFILTLDDDNAFFSKFGKLKPMFIDELGDKGINLSNVDTINTKKIKAWTNDDIATFKTYVTYYVSQIDGKLKEDFLNNFYYRVDQVRKTWGLLGILASA